MPGIGAAAHGEGGGVLSGDLIIGIDAGPDGRGVRSDVERLCCVHIHKGGALSHCTADRSGNGIPIGAGGVAAVHGLHHPAVLHIDPSADDGQRAKGAIGAVNAQRLPGRRVVKLCDRFQVGPLCLIAQAVVQQIVCHQANGVDSPLRHSGMTRLAPAADAHAFPFRLQGNVGGIFQAGNVRLDQRTGTVRHCVVGHAALKLLDQTAAHRADQLCPKMSLFTVADRKLCIRGEAEHRGRIVVQIVLHILHTGLLVVTHQRTDGITQADAFLFEELQRIEDRHHRAFIIRHTAAQHPILLQAHLEGIC